MASKTHKRELRRMKKMETQKPKRELAAIQQDYTRLAQSAGDMQYKILCWQDELAQLNQRIRELNQEANQLKETDGKTEVSTEATTSAATADNDQSIPSETSVPASIS
jgi:chromosome segregation ATPase